MARHVLEGGFDRHDRFFPDFARKLLIWRHSDFSIESGTRIYDQEAR